MVDEIELVRRARYGDVRAFESLYRLYNDRIYNLAKQATGSADDAGDAVQETFIRAWSSLPRLKSDEAFGSWLHRIALNQCRDLMKKPSRRLTMSLTSEDESETQFPDDAPDPESLTVSTETGEVVRRAIGKLNQEHRVVVTMHHLEGMDVESISKTLRVPPGTVMSRLSRAREILRRRLSSYVEGERM